MVRLFPPVQRRVWRGQKHGSQDTAWKQSGFNKPPNGSFSRGHGLLPDLAPQPHMSQKALIVRTGPEGHDGLKKLNVHLERGWQVERVAAMGGAGPVEDGPTHAALVVLERRGPDRPTPAAAVAALEEIGNESEQVVEQVVEGDGAEPPPPSAP